MVITAALLAAGGMMWWLSGLTDSRDTQPVGSSPAGRSVVARGRIEPRDRVRIVHGGERGVLLTVLVKEGDRIRAGDVLAEINTLPVLNARLELEERRLEEIGLQARQVRAPAKVAALASQRAIISQRAAEVSRLQGEFQRASTLFQNRVVSDSLFESRRAQLESAVHALEEARATLNSLSETRGIDAQVAEARVATQEAAVGHARAERDRAVIRAPIDGTILTIAARAGEMLGDDGLLQMADLDHLVVIAEVDESDMPRVAAGQAAKVRSALIAEQVAGRVSRSSNTLFKQKRPTSDIVLGRDAHIAEVEISPEGPLPPLVGSEVVVEIQAAQ
jgi:HlyD family secretion protein